MSDVIERLLEVERQARRIIADAEQKADETVSQAREEARRIVADSREEARRDADELLQREVRALQERKSERIAEESGKLASPDSVSPEKLKEAVEFVVNVIAYGQEGQD